MFLGLQCLCAEKFDKMAEYLLVIATAISRLSSLSKGFLSPKMVWRKDEQWQHHLEIWRKEALGMNLFLSCFNESLLGLGKIILLEDLSLFSRCNDPSPILHYLSFLMKGANSKQVNLQCGFVGKKFANHQ